MRLIESRDNPLYKSLRKDAQAQGRAGHPVLLEGVHVCETWLTRVGAPVFALFDAARVDEPALRCLLAAVDPANVVLMPGKLLAQLGDAVSDQGVRFVVEPPRPTLPAKITGNAILLDRVQDPGNVGTILRSAAATGVREVFLSVGSASAWSPKVLRSGQGAHFALALYEGVALDALIATAAIPVIATTLADAHDLYHAPLPANAIWVFGNEGQGVSESLVARATHRIRIDHDRHAVESLNVAMAATLCLFEHWRQHKAR